MRASEQLYLDLYDHYGPQAWWPGDGAFEVMIGAILTQNTAWTNVEKALVNLRVRHRLSPQRLAELDPSSLGQLIRPAGCFRVKARRLHNLCAAIDMGGGLETLGNYSTPCLRRFLLAVNGIGPETADAMLAYAFNRAVFVVDNYARRLFSRVGLSRHAVGDDTLQHGVEEALSGDQQALAEFHALIVTHGKHHCATRPRCETCPINTQCAFVN